MANFLVCTCIKPLHKLFGVLSLRCTMIVCAAATFLIAFYTLMEADDFFTDFKAFKILDRYVVFSGEIILGLLILICYFVKRKSYTRIIYIISLVYCCAVLSVNLCKIDIFKQIEDIKRISENIAVLFIIRVMSEFVIELYICYLVYSYEQDF